MPNLPYLLFDIGGTNTRIAISRDGRGIAKSVNYKTPKDYHQSLAAISKTGHELLEQSKAGTVIGGLPGFIDNSGHLHIWRNLSSWKNVEIKKDLEETFSCPVFIQNDAVLAGLGEAVYGAGKNYNILAYLTISTGINGARIVNKRLDANARGFEIGHQIVGHDTLEKLISGADLFSSHGKPPEEITDSTVWENLSQNIAIGINNTILYWSPDVVVLGGGLMKNISLDDLETRLKSILTIYPELPPLKKAELGDHGGLYGALHFATELNLDEAIPQKV